MSANQVLDNKKLGRVTVTLEHQQKHISILVYVGIAVATLVAYEPIRHNYFVSYDDDNVYFDNPQVTSGITRQFARSGIYKAAFLHVASADLQSVICLITNFSD